MQNDLLVGHPESLDISSNKNAIASIPKGVANVRLETLTPQGAAFVEKYLHPPGDIPPAYQGIPDRNTERNLDYEWRLTEELNFITWNMALSPCTAVLILCPPSVYRNRFVFATDGVAYNPVAADNTPNIDLSISSFNVNVDNYRMTYCSNTFEQDANALNNAGMFYGCQFRPDVTQLASNSLQMFDAQSVKYKNHKGFKELRDRVKRHHEPALAAKSLADSVMIDVNTSTPALAVQVVSLGVMPVTPADILMRSTQSASWLAKNGAFFVQRFTEPTQHYISQTRNYTSLTGGGSIVPNVSNVTVCYYEVYTPSTDAWSLTPFNSGDQGSSIAAPDVTKWYDMTWSALLYDFSSQINSGTTASVGVTPASIVHKKIFGIETGVPFGSMNLALRRDRAILDQRALDICSTADQLKKDMLPAAANSMGGALGVMAKYAPSVLSTLGSVFSAQRMSGPKKEAATESRLNRLVTAVNRMMPTAQAAIGGASEALKKQKIRKQKKIQQPPQKPKAAKALQL